MEAAIKGAHSSSDVKRHIRHEKKISALMSVPFDELNSVVSDDMLCLRVCSYRRQKIFLSICAEYACISTQRRPCVSTKPASGRHEMRWKPYGSDYKEQIPRHENI
jgi:hypothetical protein